MHWRKLVSFPADSVGEVIFCQVKNDVSFLARDILLEVETKLDIIAKDFGYGCGPSLRSCHWGGESLAVLSWCVLRHGHGNEAVHFKQIPIFPY